MPTEELQGEICALDNTTVKQSCVIKSEKFGEISTDPTDKQFVNTSQIVELTNNIQREKLLEDKKDERCNNNDERNNKLMMQPQN